jgi:hypothetical protein
MMQKEEYNLLVFPICYSLQAWLDHIRFLKLGLPRALFSDKFTCRGMGGAEIASF